MVGTGINQIKIQFFSTILPVQILWINMSTALLLGLMLAFEPKEKGIMARRPNANGSLLTREMKFIIFIIGIVTDMVLVGMFLLMSEHVDTATVRTAVFALLALDSLFYSISCKNLRKNIWNINIFSNKLLIFSILFGFAALAAAIYVPWFNGILETVPIGLSLWAVIIGLAFVNIILIEVAKFYFIKTKQTE